MLSGATAAHCCDMHGTLVFVALILVVGAWAASGPRNLHPHVTQVRVSSVSLNIGPWVRFQGWEFDMLLEGANLTLPGDDIDIGELSLRLSPGQSLPPAIQRQLGGATLTCETGAADMAPSCVDGTCTWGSAGLPPGHLYVGLIPMPAVVDSSAALYAALAGGESTETPQPDPGHWRGYKVRASPTKMGGGRESHKTGDSPLTLGWV